jgi:hypothetical protein
VRVSKTVSLSPSSSDADRVDLRDPYLAAILAWLLPGAGHWYQGRRSKAVLFFLCIVGTFGYGLWIGEGRVVYAAWGPSPEEKRLPFLCQAGVGTAALPALYQAKRFGNDQVRQEAHNRAVAGQGSFWTDEFMVPPVVDSRQQAPPDELDGLNRTLNRRFELGTVYTMVAGLLNILVIFDAFGGPAYGSLKKREEEKKAGEPPAEKGPEKGTA